MNFLFDHRSCVRGVLVALTMVFAVSTSSYAAPAKPIAPVITLTIEKGGQLFFQWNKVKGATYYRLMVDKDDNGQFQQVGADLTTTTRRYQAPKRDLLSDKEPQYRVDACNAAGCTPSSVTNESQANLLNAPMSNDMQKAFDDLLDGKKKK